MDLKKIKIILYFPLLTFFLAGFFYFSLPTKAAQTCSWLYARSTITNYTCAGMQLGQESTNSSIDCANASLPAACNSTAISAGDCVCCCKTLKTGGASATWNLNDNTPKLQIPDLNVKFSAKVCAPDPTTGQTICKISWIGEYIAAIYKYAIGIVGILAAVVLMVGGVIWIVAGGSATMIGEAKAWIGASLTGLVIALCSYLILYQINPALTIFGPLGIARVEKAAPAVISASQACQKYIDPAGTNIIKYVNIPLTDKTDYPTNCSTYNNAFNSLGNAAKYLKALAATESSCQPQAQSPAGACGLMQLMPDTAKNYDTRASSCQWLKDNPVESIKIAAQYINANSGAHSGQLTKIFAGYNSGYSTSPNTVNGKKGGLAASSDCPGYKAFECCINPGELAETQDHVYKSLKFYHSEFY